MKQMINPRLFKPAAQKVKFPYHDKFYLSRLALQGVLYPIKTFGDAMAYAQKVLNRWIAKYDLAVIAMAQEEIAPTEATA